MMKRLQERPAASAKKVAGRLCLDFVNLVGGWEIRDRDRARPRFGIRDDRLRDYADLVAFSLDRGVVDESSARRLMRRAEESPQEAQTVWKRAVALREALHGVAWTFENGKEPHAHDLEILAAEIDAAHAHRVLGARAGKLEWKVEDSGLLEAPLGSVARSAEDYFMNGDLSRLHTCPGDDCGWIFEDTTKNRSRRWCDMGDCGNAAKVRDYRARAARGQTTPRSRRTSS